MANSLEITYVYGFFSLPILGAVVHDPKVSRTKLSENYCVDCLGEDAPRVSSQVTNFFLAVKDGVKFSVTKFKPIKLYQGKNRQKIRR